MIDVSVIIPAFNERATILDILRAVRAQTIDGVRFEVIVVDDGSTDGTGDMVEANSNLCDRLIRVSHRGKGGAVLAGLRAASGDYVLFQDADLEYDPADYARLMEPVLRFGADLVMGSRVLAPRYIRVFYFWHLVGNRLLTLIFNVLNNTTFTDIYSCYLLYRRELIDPDRLARMGWDQHAEILSRAVARAKTMYEVPISYHGRTYAEGKKIRAYHALAVVRAIVVDRIARLLSPPEPRP
ncbi:MAG: glycosyltransferase family 2 protein [Alphaproteobacteria bacterium]|nr:glycosyltransferase family 2 protein [Alphaproteobacteria bacterium]MBM3732441.1 glycosyltransferase family 2 protein [Acidimicrobiia bacterium]